MLKKIPYASCQPILQRYDAGDEVAALDMAQATPEELIAALREKKLYIELMTFLCHALPMRETLWLTCQALKIRAKHWSAEQTQAIEDCARWFKEPDEASRRLAEQHVAKLGLKCAPGWLAQAVFWNGTGSIAALDQPQVMPPEFLYAKAAAGAINTAAALPEWTKAEVYNERVTELALKLARGER